MKRISAFLLALAVVLSLSAAPSFAQEKDGKDTKMEKTAKKGDSKDAKTGDKKAPAKKGAKKSTSKTDKKDEKKNPGK